MFCSDSPLLFFLPSNVSRFSPAELFQRVNKHWGRGNGCRRLERIPIGIPYLSAFAILRRKIVNRIPRVHPWMNVRDIRYGVPTALSGSPFASWRITAAACGGEARKNVASSRIPYGGVQAKTGYGWDPGFTRGGPFKLKEKNVGLLARPSPGQQGVGFCLVISSRALGLEV